MRKLNASEGPGFVLFNPNGFKTLGSLRHRRAGGRTEHGRGDGDGAGRGGEVVRGL